MNQVLREQAIWAGFRQDPLDGNFYAEQGWQNEQLCKLQQLVCLDLAKHLAKHALQHASTETEVARIEQLIAQWYNRYEIVL